MDATVTLDTRQLAPMIGAEIRNIDLRERLPQQTIDDIRKLWNSAQVLIIRNQELTEKQQRDFVGRFGELGKRKRPPAYLKERTEGRDQQDPNVMLVSNIVEGGKPVGSFGDGDMWFHIDSGYTERPYKYTVLYGVELPSRGGNTLFANMYAVYDALDEELKTKLEGRKALHIHEYERRKKVDISGDISTKPHWYHPVFVTHPETGRKSLFVDRLMTRRIEGLPQDESDDILEKLFTLTEQKRFLYEHEWQLGDVVMWDNRCTVHGRTWFPKDERRLLRRCTVEGEPLHEYGSARE